MRRLALGALLTGCVIDHHDSCSALVEVDTGASIDHTAGVDAGYYPSYLGNGSWHLEWTCDTKLSAFGCEFSGSVTSATLANVTSDRFEDGDLLSIGDGFAQWDTGTSTGIDGLNFSTAPGDSVHFDLEINGELQPDFVFVPSGGVTASPNCLPIDVAPDVP